MAGSSPEQQARVEIGIVGGGIVGLILAIGLIRRNVSVRVFEQSRSFREIGAGIGWTANTVRCMGLIDPAIQKAHKACGAVALSQGNTEDQNDYLRYIDGYNRHPDGDEHQQKLLYRINAGYQGLLGCRRDQLLESLVPLLPPGTVELRKRLQGIQENGPDGKVRLSFADGTSADVDAGEFVVLRYPVGRHADVNVESSAATASSPRSGNTSLEPTTRHRTLATRTSSPIAV